MIPAHFLFQCCHLHRDRRSSPTRRSSDLLEHRDPLREACRFGADDCCPQSFFAATPARDRRDLRSGQRSSCIDADRKSTRLNSSHVASSYAVFCLKKKTSTSTEHAHHGI